MKRILTVAATATALAIVAQPAGAAIVIGSFSVTAAEGLRNGQGFSVADGNPFSGPNTASATFTYTGAINFDNRATPQDDINSAFGFSAGNISGYSGTGTVTTNSNVQVANFTSLADFLQSSGSAGGFEYGSYYTFDLGTLVAGTVLTITHDDGAAFFQGDTRIGATEAGPTPVRTSTVTIENTGATTLRYSRQNGSPSVLIVDADVPAVPEPGTWALMILGFGAVGGSARYRRRRTGVAIA